MSERGDYRTRQREAVLRHFASQPDRPMTADEVHQDLSRSGLHIGRTTVYRCISMLYEKGSLIAFKDQKSSAPVKYQHRPQDQRRMSMRCSGCGMVAALSCDAVNEFEKHLNLDHGFALNEEECLLPGLCRDCRGTRESSLTPEAKGNQ